MRVVIQRVLRAGVHIGGRLHCSIGNGLLVFVGIEDADGEDDVDWISSKLVGLRVFDDASGVMNLAIRETNGEILLVSQFTLHASTKKGNRPSYVRASKPEKAVPLYEKLIAVLGGKLGREIATGVFGADMKVELVNDGPVTLVMDSRARE
jgi:D-tyrosyl-tRNA(Tyr) deacylase